MNSSDESGNDSLSLIPLLGIFAFSVFSCLCTPGDSLWAADVPDWSQDAVWYQIFPERFRNGDPSNDPTIRDIAGSWPHDTSSAWQLSPWTADWYELQPWEKQNSRGFYFNVQRRRYGGDIQGIINQLDYLADLGINTIYLNPIFESPSLHKYDATMHHHVDNNFGPTPAADRKLWRTEDPADPDTWQWSGADSLFLQLIREVHKRDMKIIIDGVFNHVGMTNFAFRDVVKRQKESPFSDWFIIQSWDNPLTQQNEFEYQGWFGVRELPEIREDEEGLVDGPRQYFDAVVRRWMDPDNDGDPSDGIDGWRLDVAEKVAKPYWRHFRRLVKSINPDAYITAELFWEDWEAGELIDTGPWLQGEMFDAAMNYHFASYCVQFFLNEDRAISPTEFDRKLREYRGEHPSNVNFAMQNLVDSHDTDRVGSMIVNPDRIIDHRAGVRDHPEYKVRKPSGRERRIQKLIAVFQMTYPGAPMIYYGDEVGMWGADDPDCRKPMVWADLDYEAEDAHPFGRKGYSRPVDTVQVQQELLATYRELIDIRNRSQALRRGEINTALTDDHRNLYGFERIDGDKKIAVLINNSDKRQRCRNKWIQDSWNLLYGNPESREDQVIIEPKSAVIWDAS